MESTAVLPFEGFHIRESLWKTVENNTPENSFERNEIKEVIGHSLVDETIDLDMELLSLYEIWNDFNLKSECKSLPEPPFLRENLEKQITVLVELLQQKMLKQGGELGLPAVLSDEERDIIKSVSRCNSAKPVRTNNPSIQHSRTSSLPPDDINILQIDKITNDLRQCFRDERENLLTDITKMQAALVGGSEVKESNERRSSSTIKELQHLNNKLEKEVVSDDPRKPSKVQIQKAPISNTSAKWSNNFQKPVQMSPSPPSTSNTSSYMRPNLVAHSAVKRTSVITVTLP